MTEPITRTLTTTSASQRKAGPVGVVLQVADAVAEHHHRWNGVLQLLEELAPLDAAIEDGYGSHGGLQY